MPLGNRNDDRNSVFLLARSRSAAPPTRIRTRALESMLVHHHEDQADGEQPDEDAPAEQPDRGRAGRLEPGVCYRLWTEAAQRGLLPFTPPEILDADLAPLALELALWGASDTTLPWLTSPPAAALATARALLLDLGALGDSGAITPHGRTMSRLGQHPRLAHLVLKGRELGQGKVASAISYACPKASETSICAIASTSR